MYKIDGYDLRETFGFIVASGSDDFLRLPKRKAPPSTEWEDDETEFDLSEPAFDPKQATLSGHLEADDEEDFWNKFQTLWQLLSAPGQRVIEVEEFQQSYKIFYEDQPVSRRFTPIKDAIGIVYQVSFQFTVFGFSEGFEPGTNGGFVQIINQDDVTIATVQAPGEYHVIQFSGIQDDGSGIYENSIADDL